MMSDQPESKLGMKFDTDKIRPTLLPTDALIEITKVLEFGAKKYAPDNWKLVENGKERYMDALMRHLWAYLQGEELDPETNLPHLAHAGCCVLFLLHLQNKQCQPEWPDNERIDAIAMRLRKRETTDFTTHTAASRPRLADEN